MRQRCATFRRRHNKSQFKTIITHSPLNNHIMPIVNASSTRTIPRPQQGSHGPQTPPPVLPPGNYVKHTSFSCCHIRRDIMCKHDVINIQHAHCGLVGSDCKSFWASGACNGYSYAPSLRLHSLPQPGCGVKQPISLWANMTQST